MSSELGKICTKCNKWKLMDEFHKKGNKRDSRCKECISKVKKKMYRKGKREKKFVVELVAHPEKRYFAEGMTMLAQNLLRIDNEGKEKDWC